MSVSNKLMILTAPIRSGKSTKLYNHFKDRKNTAGIISLLIDDKKYLYSIRTKEKKILELDITEDDKNNIVKVGKYIFNKNVFQWGQIILADDLIENPDLIVIDEIGHLELSGNGLAPTAFQIINSALAGNQKVLVVVRDKLLKEFLDYIKLKEENTYFFHF